MACETKMIPPWLMFSSGLQFSDYRDPASGRSNLNLLLTWRHRAVLHESRINIWTFRNCVIGKFYLNAFTYMVAMWQTVWLLTCDHVWRNKNIHYEQGSRKFSLGHTKQMWVKCAAKYFFNTYIVTTYRTKRLLVSKLIIASSWCLSWGLMGTSS